MAKNVKVINPINNSIEAQLIVLFDTFSQINNTEDICFDLTEINWIYPVLILPICAYIYENKSQYILPENEQALHYLNTINFPIGITSIPENCRKQTYIPIVFLQKLDDNNKEKLESWFQELVYSKMNIKSNKNIIFTPISELITNIFEHSNKKYGWVLAQLYPNLNFVDVCIIDTGRGIRKSYEDEKNLKFNNNIEAFHKLIEMESSTPGKDRGYGIYSSKNIICDLHGSFILISDNIAWNINSSNSIITEITNFTWQGVIAGYRIKFPTNPIDIYNYVE